MPDALSKTIPIWCAVINRLLFRDTPTAHELFTPQAVVGASEHAQIEARLETFVEDAEVIAGLIVCQLIVLADAVVSASRCPFLTLVIKETYPAVLGYPGDLIHSTTLWTHTYPSSDLLYCV